MGRLLLKRFGRLCPVSLRSCQPWAGSLCVSRIFRRMKMQNCDEAEMLRNHLRVRAILLDHSFCHGHVSLWEGMLRIYQNLLSSIHGGPKPVSKLLGAGGSMMQDKEPFEDSKRPCRAPRTAARQGTIKCGHLSFGRCCLAWIRPRD